METRSLEITVTSTKGLKNVSKTEVFVTAKLSGDPKCSDHREQGIQVAKDNGVVRFVVDQVLAEANRLVITFKIKKLEQRGGGGGDKEIGEVHVPVKDLLDHLGNDKTGKRYVTYRIKKANGKPKGDLSFTYSFAGYYEHPPVVMTGGCSRYPVNKPVRPITTTTYPAYEPTYLVHESVHLPEMYLAHEPVCSTTYQHVLNRPVLGQLLPSIGSFSCQPEILSTETTCFPGLYMPPHGYPMSYSSENPPAMYPPSIFPGLSTCTPPEGYPTVAPVHTQPELYPPMSPYGF